MISARSFSLGLLTLISVLPTAEATIISGWKPLYRGVDYATGTNSANETPGPLNIYTLRVSLHTPGVSFTTTASSAAKYPGFETFSQTTGDFVNAVGAKAGINANFFSVVSTTAQPENLSGLAVSNGSVVSPPETGFPAFMLTQGNVPSIAVTPPTFDLSGIWNAVSGSSIILQDGQAVVPPGNAGGDPFNPNPRSAIGISQDGNYLYLMVIDGRTTVSVGCTQEQTGAFLAMFGAYQGLNLDGGGSTALVNSIAPGVVGTLNSPSGGSQRLDGNNLAVFADALPSLPYTQVLQASKPAAWYRFNETSGAAATDFSGNGHTGTYPATGVTPGVADQPISSEAGAAATFNGAANTHVTVPYSSDLNAGSVTVEAWVKPTTASNAAFQGIVSNRDDKGSGAAGNAGYILYMGPATGDGGTARWQFWTGGNTSATYTAVGRNNSSGFGLGPAVVANTWTHLAGTFNATSGPDAAGRYTGTQSLYVNGALALSLGNIQYLPNPNKTLYLGAGSNELQTSDNLRFTGSLDEIAVYSRALTAAEIQAHYASGVATLSAPTVSLASPADGAQFAAGAPIAITAAASDADGTVTKVEFFDGTSKLGEATQAPFTYTWTGAAPGSHVLSAKATDDSTLTTSSNSLTIAVTGPGADSDGDGIPDGYEVAHGLNPADPADALLDRDGDGVINRDEFLLGLNPQVSDHYTWAATVDSVSGAVTLAYEPTVTGRDYQIWYSDDLVTWNPANTAVAGTGNSQVWVDDGTLPPSNGHRFYQMRVTLNP